MPDFFSEGNTPLRTDTRWRSLEKILGATIAGGSGPGGSVNPVYTGAAPPAAPAFPLEGALFTPDNNTLPLQAWTPGVGWHEI